MMLMAHGVGAVSADALAETSMRSTSLLTGRSPRSNIPDWASLILRPSIRISTRPDPDPGSGGSEPGDPF
jgi:hypothetical protein